MKFSSYLFLATALSLICGSNGQGPNGELQLTPCQESKGKIMVNRLTFDPNPPTIGKPVLLNFNGTFAEDFPLGMKVNLEFSKDGQVLFRQEKDFCQMVESLSLLKSSILCPLVTGTHNILAKMNVPGFIPSSLYGVNVKITKPDNDEVICLEGTTHLQQPLKA
ncbi:hypothetical protein J3Q64DRAFT_1694570 [Phycomyces blakesleeanus]|uniref:Phosphatidylglycerol/phosphatidylinositol transfer protein n=2 Tax=Phycomyces blakesleeanus TaxID=4837 RepID=A0A167QPT3_PHYB8|nr:hypothetical protein PHYBLDRAFT_163081 [Phycomyces blakesleeanus NRRL 1555(-)]OAD80031.1 hypothetical protein PHYBLDRAFT_163081 [Phycomyces blakesleeanus NRRL 1555(-)]|eukprot:XP_018298071.1 hypothetical protein PHYBLDRAFT_163081 [Phycomyces blakesleeanus NRRL 1555(-)]